VAISYRQVCFGFPKGGGAYAVASSTLGTVPSLVAASSLVIDYVLTAAVSTLLVWQPSHQRSLSSCCGA
jgi:amino acid transporter